MEDVLPKAAMTMVGNNPGTFDPRFNATSQVAVRNLAVPGQISRATEQAELFRKQLEELEMRLITVMGPDDPVVAADPRNSKQDPGCELAEKLSYVVSVIEGGNTILAKIIKRLEI